MEIGFRGLEFPHESLIERVGKISKGIGFRGVEFLKENRNFQAGCLNLLKNSKGDGLFYTKIPWDRDRKSDVPQ